jgi:hypothetical protein
MTRVLAFSCLLLSATLAACGGPGGPSNICNGTNCVYVSGATYNADFTGMGNLNSVNLSSDVPSLNLDATLDPDVRMKIVGDELFVLMRDSGSLRIYDPTTLAVKLELPTGDTTFPSSSSYPQDFWVNNDNDDIFVTLSGNDAAHSLGVLNRNTPGTVVYLGLPQDPADTDGKPEPYQIYYCEERIFITLQSYTVNTDGTVSYNVPGRIVDMTPNTRSIRNVVALQGKNPSQITDTGRGDCFDTVVASSGNLQTVPDGTGNIERFNLGQGVSKGVLITDSQLGGRPVYLAAVSSKLMYVANYFDPEPNGMGATFLSSVRLTTFDIDTMSVLNNVTGPYGNINFLRLYDGKLFYGAGIYAGMEEAGKGARGLYIVTPTDGSMITVPPVSLGLTPSEIAFPQ